VGKKIKLCIAERGTMNPKRIKEDLIKLRAKLEEKIIILGSRKASELSGEPQNSISDWLGGRKNFSWEKIIDIAMKVINK
jgi:hypothetical protein